MALEDPSSDDNTQVVRRVHENEGLNTTASLSKVFRLEFHFDDVSGKNIILWEDILSAFKDVVHVRHGEKILPFLKGRDFKTLQPLRIAAFPGNTLDIIVADQLVRSGTMSSQETLTKPLRKGLSVVSLQKAMPDPPQLQSTAESNNVATNTIRRNPAYGLVEEAMENYTHIENPATAPTRRGPQVIPDNQSPADDDHHHDQDPSKPKHSLNEAQQRARGPQETVSGITRDFAETLMKAKQGDKDAQVVGDMYKDGQGVAQQHARGPQETASGITREFAETLMKAKQGNKDAQVAVGDMYKDGQGVTQDYRSAMDWYLKAAEQKDPVAQRKVGILYNKGLGVTQNFSTAMEWYLLAAEQGSPPALRNVGVMYHYGQGVPKDYTKAMQWYQLAAYQGDTDALSNIGFFHDRGLGVPEDVAQAAGWYRKAAEKGLAVAQYNLGTMYQQGRGVPKDKARAMEWYKKAAGQGYEAATNMIDELNRQSDIVFVQVDQQMGSVQTEKKKSGLFKRMFK